MVTAPFLLLRHTLPHMYARRWGRVVNISSVHGLRASAYKSAYVAAKHALEGLSKVTALEAAPHGVTSNCVNPGYVRTPLVEHQITSQAAAHGITPERVVSDVLLTRPAIKELIDPEAVAAVVLWLCGPQTAQLTGASLPLDGAGPPPEIPRLTHLPHTPINREVVTLPWNPSPQEAASAASSRPA